MSINKLIEHQIFKCNLCRDAQPQPVLARQASSRRGDPALPLGHEGPIAPEADPSDPQEGLPAPQEVPLTLQACLRFSQGLGPPYWALAILLLRRLHLHLSTFLLLR